MTSTKKYYWLKLKEDFFDDKVIKYLRRLPEGPTLVIIYLKMQLKSLKTEGFLRYDGILPTCEEELALVLDESPMLVSGAINALEKIGVVERWDNDVLYMKAMQALIGSEAESAARVRKHREMKKLKQESANLLQSNAELLHCNGTVTACNTEIEIDKEKEVRERDKRKDIETDDMLGAETAPSQNPQDPPVISLPLNDKTEYPITLFDINDWSALYPAVDIMQELRKMRGWLDANPTRKKTQKGIRRFINSWLAREQDKPHIQSVQKVESQQSASNNPFLDMLKEEEGQNG